MNGVNSQSENHLGRSVLSDFYLYSVFSSKLHRIPLIWFMELECHLLSELVT